MGLASYVVDAIIREHAYKAISGDVLLIGRQTVYMTPQEAIETVRSHGLTPAIDAKDIVLDRDTVNRRPGWADREMISDASLFALLGNTKVKALDHTSYEGAEVVHDLTTEVPPRLRGCADFIVDGSTLDNTFNPALTLKNYADLLRPGGRLFAINTFSNHFDPYVIPSPLWYLDYFVMNRFADCKVYVMVHMPESVNAFCINPECLLDPRREVRNFVAPYELATVIIAEKAANSTTTVWPTQAHYRSDNDWSIYRGNLAEMAQSRRPHILRSLGEMQYFDIIGGYLFVDQHYMARDPSTEESRVRASSVDTAQPPTLVGRAKQLVLRLVHTAGYDVVKVR